MVTRRKPQRVLDRITDGEAHGVLRALLKRHPDLKAEAEGLAVSLASDVDRQRVAAELVAAIEGLGLEELGARAGRQVYGYVEPTEAAWEILEEAVEPAVGEITRLLQVGLEDPARAQCEGVLLGLHELQLDHMSNDLLQYAPDFPGEAAGNAVEVWLKGPGGPRVFDEELLHEELYEWADLVARAQRQER